MTKIAVANASGKFEQREQPPPRPAVRSAEPASTVEREWFESPPSQEIEWWVRKPGSKSGDTPTVDPEFVNASFVDPELTVDHSPRAQALAILEILRLDLESAKADFESGSYNAVLARRPNPFEQRLVK
jgi:hypothetical protein